MLLLAASCLIFAGSAVAQDEETIDHVTDDNVIVLQDGNAYQSEDATSTTWLPNEDVLILDDKIVNKDENEAVDVTPTTPPDEDADEDDAQD